MKPEEQRIAIAEFCGWQRDERCDCWRNPSEGPHAIAFMNGGHAHRQLPNYLNDLNAMNEAVNHSVERLGFPFQEAYTRELRAIVTRRRRDCNEMQVDFWMAEATAAQRAEALLRTLDLWKN